MSKTNVILHDRRCEQITCGIRAVPKEIGRNIYNATHYVELTQNQLKKIRRELPNGCSTMVDDVVYLNLAGSE